MRLCDKVDKRVWLGMTLELIPEGRMDWEPKRVPLACSEQSNPSCPVGPKGEHWDQCDIFPPKDRLSER